LLDVALAALRMPARSRLVLHVLQRIGLPVAASLHLG
jgi:hypothetical protein